MPRQKSKAITVAELNRQVAAAYLLGIRESYGVLSAVLNELPTEVRLRFIDKMKELDDHIRSAEKGSSGI